jgi:hypothetical protein
VSSLERWRFAPEPLADELLSSYLARAALLYGSTPYRFCAYHFSSTQLWNRDIDRSAPTHLLDQIAGLSGVDLAILRRGMLPRFFEFAKSRGTWPWVNGVGIYHRKRRRHGLAFCGHCLRENGYFRRAWRFSVVTMCAIHECSLRDGCPSCDAPLAPHRQTLQLNLCAECGADLRAGIVAEPNGSSLFSRLQVVLQPAFQGAPVILGGRLVDAADVLRGSRLLVGVLARAHLRRGAGEDIALLRTGASVGLERARVPARQALLAPLGRVLVSWPTSFQKVSSALEIRQTAFPLNLVLPTWLAEEVARLPPGNRWRFSAAKGTGSLASKLDAIESSGGARWRGERAKLLLGALRRSRHGL